MKIAAVQRSLFSDLLKREWSKHLSTFLAKSLTGESDLTGDLVVTFSLLLVSRELLFLFQHQLNTKSMRFKVLKSDVTKIM